MGIYETIREKIKLFYDKVFYGYDTSKIIFVPDPSEGNESARFPTEFAKRVAEIHGKDPRLESKVD